MKGLIYILVLIFFGWCFGSTYWYVCKIKELCEDSTEKVAAENQGNDKEAMLEEVHPGNLLFTKSSAIPETNEITTRLLDSLKNNMSDGYLLHIIGKHFPDEDGGQQLGLDRAGSVLKLLQGRGFKGIAKLSSSLMEGSIGEEKYKAVSFESALNQIEESESKNSDFTVTSTDTKIIINFPVASADPHGNTELTSQLREFVAKAGDSKLIVSGHTDNTGKPKANIYYGQLRADVIAKMLIEQGAKKSNISTVSKGQSDPIATNDTEKGRKENRRVEIEITSN